MYRLNSADTKHSIIAILALLACLIFVIEGTEALGFASFSIGWRLLMTLPVFLAICIWLGLRQVSLWKSLAESLNLRPRDADNYYGLPALCGTMEGHEIEISLTAAGEKTKRIYYTVFQVKGHCPDLASHPTATALRRQGVLTLSDEGIAYQIRGHCFEFRRASEILRQLITLL